MKLNLKSELGNNSEIRSPKSGIAQRGEWRMAGGRHPAPAAGSAHGSPHPRRASGFTLVEMLLVLVILATLAAIVYPKVMGRSEQARLTAAQTQIANFKTALDAFEVDNGYYPKGKNGLMDLVQQPRDTANWHGPYLESIPKDPWQNDYIYECPGKHNPSSYDIYSLGSPGADSPVGNWQTQKR